MPEAPSSFVVPTLSVTIATPPVVHKQVPLVPIIQIEGITDKLNSKSDQHILSLHNRINPTLLRDRGKRNSLDFHPAPAITITTLAEADSDPDTPPGKIVTATTTAARFLSPFLGVGTFHTSESNLSSSGYSSAYSPGPSRCNSNNPLYPTDIEEPSTPSVTSIPSKPMCLPQPNPYTLPQQRNKKRTNPIKPLPEPQIPLIGPIRVVRTDSETTDPGIGSQPEADSALEMDTTEPEADHSDDVSIQIPIVVSNTDSDNEAQRQSLVLSSSLSKESPILQKPPPAIVVHNSLNSESSLDENGSNDKSVKLSPVSSRSESPISDSRLSVHRIYPAFFGGGNNGKLDLPYTDSDGLYDCPSSEVVHSDSHKSSPLRKLGRKKTKRTTGKTKSNIGLGNTTTTNDEETSEPSKTGPQKGSSLELPFWQPRSPRRLSPKRRMRAQTSVDLLSSSNESITSQR